MSRETGAGAVLYKSLTRVALAGYEKGSGSGEFSSRSLLSVWAVKKAMLPLSLFLLAATLILAGGVSGAPAKQGCETPVYENGLDLVFGRAKSQAAADKVAQLAVAVGFKGVQTVQESCTVWKAVLRGLDSFSTAVEVQAEARTVRKFPTIECVTSQQTGQLQAIFGTLPTLGELSAVIARANSFGYVGLKTKRAPCGGYQAYVAGFSDKAQAFEFAQTATERTGLHVTIIKA